MIEGLDFSAVKYSGGGDEDVLMLDQPTSNGVFDGSDLEMFSPIKANEVFEIEIRSDLDPMSVLEWLRFDNSDPLDFEDADNFEYPVSWLQKYEFEPSNGVVTRLAILRQGNQEWQIVGIPHNDELVLILRSEEDAYLPAARYHSDRILAEYDYHKDGPGPVSWDLSGALIEVGKWWISAYGGDNSQEDTIYERPNDVAGMFLNWLSESPAVLIFVLLKVKCLWSDAHLIERYNQAIENISEADSGVSVFTGLSESEVAQVISRLRDSSAEISELIRIMQQDQSLHANALVDYLEAAYKEQDIAPLLNVEELLESIRDAQSK